MANNKVIFGNQTIIDLTDADVTAADILDGKYGYGPTGEKLRGTLKVVVELTQAQYDALSAADKAKDIIYMIKDGTDVVNVVANDITYTPGVSVADALDDMSDAISALQSVDTLPHKWLASDADLDEVTESGIYTYFQTQGHSVYAQNNSVTGAGTLLVLNGAAIHQVVFIFNTNIYVRRYAGNSWSEWRGITLSAIGSSVASIHNVTVGPYSTIKDFITGLISQVHAKGTGIYYGARASSNYYVAVFYNISSNACVGIIAYGISPAEIYIVGQSSNGIAIRQVTGTSV